MRRAIDQGLRHLFGGPDAVGIPFERVGRPERRPLFLVPPVLIEGHRRRQQFADGGEGAVRVDGCLRAGDDLPHLVAIASNREDFDALRARVRGADGVAIVPSPLFDDASALAAGGDERNHLGALRAFEHGQRFASEDVRMPGQVEQGYGAIEVGGGEHTLMR